MSGLAKMNLSKLIGCPDTQMLFYFHTARVGGGGGAGRSACTNWGPVMRGGGEKRKALKREKGKLPSRFAEKTEKEKKAIVV